MRRTLITCYRAKPGKLEALHKLCAMRFARLYVQGLVTRKLPLLLRACDGSVLEVCEWKSQAAIDSARGLHDAIALQRELSEVCDYVPLAALPGAAELFSAYESAPVALVLPPFFHVYNHVQVDDRISTSGVVKLEVIEEIAKQGYACVINLLPDSSPHALADEAELVQARGLAYHYIPVDFAAPNAENYAAFERALDGLAHDQRVFVHCAANMRVTAFIAIYGARRFGWSLARAAQHVAEVWEPNPIWRAFLDAQLPRS